MFVSFVRSCRDLFRPRILGFVLLVPFISFVLWSVIGTSIFKLLGPQIETFIHSIEWLSNLSTNISLVTILTTSVDFVAALLLMLLLFPFVVWTALVFTAAFAMPWILRLLRPMYPLAFRSPTRVSMVSTWLVSFKVFVKVIPIYIVLLMLAWVPQVYVIGTFILSAWVNAYFMAVEVLSELTDEVSLRSWIREHRLQLFTMGSAMVMLLFIPFVQLVTPVFAGLWVAHFILSDFSQERDA